MEDILSTLCSTNKLPYLILLDLGTQSMREQLKLALDLRTNYSDAAHRRISIIP